MTAHRKPALSISADTCPRAPRAVGANVPTRHRRVQGGADRCGRLRGVRYARVQVLWLCVGHREHAPNCHGKEGVAGSSPAEGSSSNALVIGGF